MDHVAVMNIPHCFVRFNHSHYIKVWEAKRALGETPVLQHKISHPLVGKRVREENREYTVQAVYREFYAGWFIKLLLRTDSGSHGVRYYENINCIDPTVLEGIEETLKEMVVLN